MNCAPRFMLVIVYENGISNSLFAFE